MMIKLILNSFRADIKFIVRDPMLLMASLAPILLILFLRLVFPLLADFIYTRTSFDLNKYYSLAAITMVCIIPMLFGMVYAFILLDENDAQILHVISVTPAGKVNFIYMRMFMPTFLSFVMIILTIIFTQPVSSEGWLRTLYISFLIALQAPFTFLFIGSLARNKVEGLALSKLYGIFLVAVPVGLLLHHPWNYFAFFSPLYWISWAWVTSYPFESLLYGAISLIITIGSILIFLRYFLKKHRGF